MLATQEEPDDQKPQSATVLCSETNDRYTQLGIHWLGIIQDFETKKKEEEEEVEREREREKKKRFPNWGTPKRAEEEEEEEEEERSSCTSCGHMVAEDLEAWFLGVREDTHQWDPWSLGLGVPAYEAHPPRPPPTI